MGQRPSLPGGAPSEPPAEEVAVVGAGFGGASLPPARSGGETGGAGARRRRRGGSLLRVRPRLPVLLRGHAAVSGGRGELGGGRLGGAVGRHVRSGGRRRFLRIPD